MSSFEASEIKLEIFNNSNNSTYIDPDSGLWYLAYLRDKGYDWEKINNLQKIINEMMRRDNSNNHHKKNDLLKKFKTSLNN